MSDNKKTFIKAARKVLEEWGKDKIYDWDQLDEFSEDLQDLTDRIACAVLMTCVKDKKEEPSYPYTAKCKACSSAVLCLEYPSLCPSCAVLRGSS